MQTVLWISETSCYIWRHVLCHRFLLRLFSCNKIKLLLMTLQWLCALIGAGDHQQRSRKLCVSIRTSVAKWLEEHHRHRSERNGIHHPRARQETHQESERSEVTEFRRHLEITLESEMSKERLNLTHFFCLCCCFVDVYCLCCCVLLVHCCYCCLFRCVLPGYHHHLCWVWFWFCRPECVGKGWSRGTLQVSMTCNLSAVHNINITLICGSHCSSVVVCVCLSVSGLWLQSGVAMATGSTSSSLDQSELRFSSSDHSLWCLSVCLQSGAMFLLCSGSVQPSWSNRSLWEGDDRPDPNRSTRNTRRDSKPGSVHE